MGICFEYIALRYIEQQGNWLAPCIWDAVILQVRVLSTLRSYRNIGCSPQYKRVGDATFKAYKVWNEWQLHTRELIAYTLIWGLWYNWLTHDFCKVKFRVRVPHSPHQFPCFIMLSFCQNPLLGSQRLKKLPLKQGTLGSSPCGGTLEGMQGKIFPRNKMKPLKKTLLHSPKALMVDALDF